MGMDDDKTNFQTLLNSAYFYLKFRQRTEKEMRNYLLKKIKKRHLAENLLDPLITELREQDLINDKNFVSWYVEQRSGTKQKSASLLTRELQRLGVSRELVDDYFSRAPLNEEQLATEALKRKWSRLREFDTRKRFEKAASFLMRRGFSFDVAKKVVRRLEEG